MVNFLLEHLNLISHTQGQVGYLWLVIFKYLVGDIELVSSHRLIAFNATLTSQPMPERYRVFN